MPVTVTGMTLLTDGDNEAGYDGVTAGPDTYNVSEQGANSESWNVAKNSTETSTLTKAAALPLARGLYMFWMKSDVSYYYTDIRLYLESSNNNFKEFIVATAAKQSISGDFHPIVVDYVNKGVETGAYDPANHGESRIAVDNSSSGNIRSVINNWIDAIYYGSESVIGGSTDNDKGFTEAAAVDNLTANKYGLLEDKSNIIYSQGDVRINGSNIVSNGETLVFKETDNGFDSYVLDIEGTVTFVNTNILVGGNVDFHLDAILAVSFNMTGGSIVGASNIDLPSAGVFDGVVCTDCAATLIPKSVSSVTWNQSGLVTITSTGELVDAVLNDGIDSAAAKVNSSLEKLGKSRFVKPVTTQHAVEFEDLDGGTNVTSIIAEGYDVGVLASPVTPTNTGNETINVLNNSGTITISVASGATIPSIKSAGAIVNVVGSLTTFSFTVSPSITGYEWRVYEVTAVGDMEGQNEIAGSEVAVSDSQSISHSYLGQPIAVQILDDGYEESITYYTLDANDLDIIIELDEDINS